MQLNKSVELLISKNKLLWKCHTPNLLREIVECNETTAILKATINILGRLLYLVAERAIELNVLMCRLTLYSIADPESPDYNEKLLEKIYDE